MNTPTPKLTVYENRGGEVWERQPDGRRELFAEDIIRKLTTQELELTAAREELVETRKDFMCLAELLDGHDATECRMNLVRLKEQRDRLEEALANIARQNLSEEMDDHSCERADWQGGYESIVKIAREALQSLNQPTEP